MEWKLTETHVSLPLQVLYSACVVITKSNRGISFYCTGYNSGIIAGKLLGDHVGSSLN